MKQFISSISQYLSSFAQKYPVVASGVHTFISVFLVTLIGALDLIPADKILSPATWTTAFIGGLLGAAVRAGVKAVSPLS